MTSEEYWNGLVEKNPKLVAGDTVTLKVSGLKAIVEQAHSKGYEDACKKLSKTVGACQNSGINDKTTEALRAMFGMH